MPLVKAGFSKHVIFFNQLIKPITVVSVSLPVCYAPSWEKTETAHNVYQALQELFCASVSDSHVKFCSVITDFTCSSCVAKYHVDCISTTKSFTLRNSCCP